MNDSENLLDERLAALEEGQPLGTCLEGLPAGEAVLLKKAALLTTAQAEGLDPSRLADQRRQFLEHARGTRQGASSPALRSSSRGWLFPAAALSGAALLALFAILFAAGLFAVLHLRQTSGGLVAQQPGLPSQAGAALGSETSQNTPPPSVAASPELGTLSIQQGIIEVRLGGGDWTRAQSEQGLKAGDSLRTGHLSSVRLVFYDGSAVQVGPDTQLSIDTLNAPKSGARVVVLTQALGTSKFNVAKSSDPASRFEVRTPSGSGMAKGTAFTVTVNSAKLARFDVDEGAVAVTGQKKVVTVYAGQTSLIPNGSAPDQPVFHISGEGKVEQMGQVWKIAGRTFRSDSNTIVTGQPKVGDLVFFSARIVSDGAPILDQVILLMTAPDSQFSFSGKVESTAADTWKVAGLTVKVDKMTQIDPGIQAGDTVEVKGSIAADGTLHATRIRLVATAGLPFEFSGVVQTMGATAWMISGIQVDVDANTAIDSGIVAGNTVHVTGRIQASGNWIASSIRLAKEKEAEFSLSGQVESIDPWVISGVGFKTDAHTEIEAGIQVGDQVRVEGRILSDGSWVAEQIELVEKISTSHFEFNGTVSSTNPWVVNGINLKTDANTQIAGDIQVGSLVHVSGDILADGTLLAHEIQGLDQRQEGCVSFSSAVRNLTADQIVLLDWQTIKLNKEIEVQGDLKVATVIVISECHQEDGQVTIINVVVVYQLNSINDVLPIVIEKHKHHGDEEDEDDDED